MPPITITDPVKDVAKINSAFQQLDALYSRLAAAEKQINFVQATVNEHSAVNEPTGVNDVTFKWDGAGAGSGTGTLSWAASSILDRQGRYIPILAGSISGLTASTTYWLGWNPAHQVMARSTTLGAIHGNTGTLIICSVTTGTDSASLVAVGGGGTDAGGTGFNRTKY